MPLLSGAIVARISTMTAEETKGAVAASIFTSKSSGKKMP